jgi:hypothetical protein
MRVSPAPREDRPQEVRTTIGMRAPSGVVSFAVSLLGENYSVCDRLKRFGRNS